MLNNGTWNPEPRMLSISSRLQLAAELIPVFYIQEDEFIRYELLVNH
jgi:hypothetical protein